ncbi:hypothetical protein GCM10014719_31480 [Planomonospora parontospora subsp. antibiotica]|nr:hypothetical protein GCM10014719_31480 [Planomonospora parontospora subsp. antibiotica]GII16495.1 hypothetical protein Ppa05_32210 [Planomonospora parontospora subsp. antibiotica]
MSQSPPDRYGMSDEQALEVEQATNDLGLNHMIVEDDPRHRDDFGERLRREAPDHPRKAREWSRLVAPDQGTGPHETSQAYATDVGRDDGDLSAEERAIHIEPYR